MSDFEWLNMMAAYLYYTTLRLVLVFLIDDVVNNVYIVCILLIASVDQLTSVSGVNFRHISQDTTTNITFPRNPHHPRTLKLGGTLNHHMRTPSSQLPTQSAK